MAQEFADVIQPTGNRDFLLGQVVTALNTNTLALRDFKASVEGRLSSLEKTRRDALAIGLSLVVGCAVAVLGVQKAFEWVMSRI